VIPSAVEREFGKSPSIVSTLSVALDFDLSEKGARLSFLGELGGDDDAAGGVDAEGEVSSIPARVSAACTSASKVLRSVSNDLWSMWPNVRRALREELGGRDTGVCSRVLRGQRGHKSGGSRVRVRERFMTES
jgi:hypothetical protein